LRLAKLLRQLAALDFGFDRTVRCLRLHSDREKQNDSR
jgi:hypothetical protein